MRLLLIALTACLRCLALIAFATGGLTLLLQAQQVARVAGNEEVAELLIDGAALGDEAACARALDEGAPVDSRSPNGCTPLMLAAGNGDLRIARRLINAGADVAATSHLGATPLFMAAMSGRLEVMGALLHAGAEVDDRSAFGGTALHAAASQAQRAAAKLLLMHGADVNARDASGLTPLMVLLYIGDADAAFMAELLAAGADASIENVEGLTAHHIAEREGRDDLLALLPPMTFTR